jgi:hypothetical protein
MKWVSRKRPKIDRIACPWSIQRFINREAGAGDAVAEAPSLSASRREACLD